MLTAFVNGVECDPAAQAISIGDRGLNYGDGVFETMLLKGGRVRLLDAHLARLALGCKRLRIPYPGAEVLQAEIARACGSRDAGVVKLVLTRGVGARGYRPLPNASPTRIISVHEAPQPSDAPIRVRWCEIRLSRNPALAGIKHLNRIEQVLAQAEWNDPNIAEGLMLDSEGELVCATASNVFIVRGHEVATADLRFCGIRGVMRGEVMRLAQTLGIAVHEGPLWPEDLTNAQEVFVTSSVRGIRSVAALDSLTWSRGEITQALCEALENHA